MSEEPSEFDKRAYALQKALDKRPFNDPDESDEQTVGRAQIFYKFLTSGNDPDYKDDAPEPGEWKVGDLVLQWYPQQENFYVFRRDAEDLWRIYGPTSNRDWAGSDTEIERRLRDSSNRVSSAHLIVAIKNGERVV